MKTSRELKKESEGRKGFKMLRSICVIICKENNTSVLIPTRNTRFNRNLLKSMKSYIGWSYIIQETKIYISYIFTK